MRMVIFAAGAAMAASYFVTWVEPPFAGQEFSPSSMIGDDLQSLITEGSWQARVFVGGFAVAALAGVLALIGRASGLIALLAGLSPLVLLVHFYTRASDLQADLGLPFTVDFQDLGQAWDLMGDYVRAGLWMYLGGGAILLLAGLSMVFGRR